MPLFVCLFWMIVLSIMAYRTESYVAFMFLLLFTSLAVFANSVLSDFSATPKYQIYAILLKQVTTTSLVPLTILFIRRIRHITRQDHPLDLLWIVIPVILGTSAILLYALSGEEAISMMLEDVHANGYNVSPKYQDTLPYLFYIFTHIIYAATVMGEVIILFLYLLVLSRKEHFSLGHIIRFYFKGERIKTVELQTFFISALFLIFGIRFLSSLDVTADYPMWSVVVSILICFCMFYISYTAMFGSKPTVTRKEQRNAWRYNYSRKKKQHILDAMISDLLEDADEETMLRVRARIKESLQAEKMAGKAPAAEPARAEQLMSGVSKNWEEDDLFKRFQHLMTDEKIFLQPKLTLADVADMLETNTTYLSRMVNTAYNLGFPELINTLRIDYAEQYLLENSDAKQSEIATKCGFLSASSFNTVFKRITGVTPKIWVASAELQQKFGN